MSRPRGGGASVRSARTVVAGAVLLVGVALLALCVGRYPGEPGYVTTVPAVGHLDQNIYAWIQTIRSAPLAWLAHVFDFLGGGPFNAPFRIGVVLVLAYKRWWAKAIAFASAVLTSEALMTLLKNLIERTRPPDPLVHTSGFSFPSGHTVAVASTAVALVIVLLPPGDRRWKWGWAAAGFALLMGLSRVYLNAHWLSDAIAGVMLGAGAAKVCAAVVQGVGAGVSSQDMKPDGDILKPNAACARCGRLFVCMADQDECWCDGLTLSNEQRGALTALKLDGCVCRDCLESL